MLSGTILNAEGYRLNYCREFPKSINIVEYVHWRLSLAPAMSVTVLRASTFQHSYLLTRTYWRKRMSMRISSGLCLSSSTDAFYARTLNLFIFIADNWYFWRSKVLFY